MARESTGSHSISLSLADAVIGPNAIAKELRKFQILGYECITEAMKTFPRPKEKVVQING